MTWWPGPGWGPWDVLTAAGVRVVDDPRNLHPPVVWMEVVEAAQDACVVEHTVIAHCVAPGEDHADARRWLWLVAVPPLLPHAAEAARAVDVDGYPGVDIRLTHGSPA